MCIFYLIWRFNVAIFLKYFNRFFSKVFFLSLFLFFSILLLQFLNFFSSFEWLFPFIIFFSLFVYPTSYHWILFDMYQSFLLLFDSKWFCMKRSKIICWIFDINADFWKATGENILLLFSYTVGRRTDYPNMYRYRPPLTCIIGHAILKMLLTIPQCVVYLKPFFFF